MHITMRSSDVIERLKNVSVRDGLLVYHIWLKSQLSMAELYPMYPPNLLEKEYELSSKLHKDAFKIYLIQNSRYFEIPRNYANFVHEKFPEFNLEIITRYFSIAFSGYACIGDYPFQDWKINEDLLLGIGELNVAALINDKCHYRNRLNTLLETSITDDYLFKLFPKLLQEQNKVEEIQNKINVLEKYCRFISPNCNQEISLDLAEKKEQLKQQNLGFHSATYKLIWRYAEGTTQDWDRYTNFNSELDRFFAHFESSTQTKD